MKSRTVFRFVFFLISVVAVPLSFAVIHNRADRCSRHYHHSRTLWCPSLLDLARSLAYGAIFIALRYAFVRLTSPFGRWVIPQRGSSRAVWSEKVSRLSENLFKTAYFLSISYYAWQTLQHEAFFPEEFGGKYRATHATASAAAATAAAAPSSLFVLSAAQSDAISPRALPFIRNYFFLSAGFHIASIFFLFFHQPVFSRLDRSSSELRGDNASADPPAPLTPIEGVDKGALLASGAEEGSAIHSKNAHGKRFRLRSQHVPRMQTDAAAGGALSLPERLSRILKTASHADDFWETCAQVTMALQLILFGYAAKHLAIGSILMLMHDFCDILTSFAKALVDTSAKMTAFTTAMILMVCWAYARLYCLAKLVLLPVLRELEDTPLRHWRATRYEPVFFAILLLSLFFMNIYWFSLTVKSCLIFVYSGRVMDAHAPPLPEERTRRTSSRRTLDTPERGGLHAE